MDGIAWAVSAAARAPHAMHMVAAEPRALARRGGRRVQRAQRRLAAPSPASPQQQQVVTLPHAPQIREVMRVQKSREHNYAVINSILAKAQALAQEERKAAATARAAAASVSTQESVQKPTRQQTRDAGAASVLSAAQRLVLSGSHTTRNPDGTVNSLVPDEARAGQLVTLLEFLLGLGISIEDCGRLVKRRPQLLRLNIPYTTQPYLDFLQSAPLAMSDEQLGRTVRNGPQLFSRKTSEFTERLEFLTTEIGIAPANLPEVVSARPHVMWMSLSQARDNITWLASRLALTPDEIRSTVLAAPILLLAEPDELTAAVAWAEHQIGFDSQDELHDFVAQFPKIFMYHAETSLQRRIDYFRHDLRLPQQVIRKIVLTVPAVLEKSVTAHLKPAVARLYQEGLWKEPAELVQLLESAPKLLDTAFETRIEFLYNTVGLDAAQLRRVVTAFPGTLVLSVERTLEPKWNFLTTVFGGGVAELMHAPSFFGASLERCLMPRLAFAATKKVQLTLLDAVISTSDDEFCAKVVQCPPDEYKTFLDSGTWMLVYSPVM